MTQRQRPTASALIIAIAALFVLSAIGLLIKHQRRVAIADCPIDEQFGPCINKAGRWP